MIEHEALSSIPSTTKKKKKKPQAHFLPLSKSETSEQPLVWLPHPACRPSCGHHLQTACTRVFSHISSLLLFVISTLVLLHTASRDILWKPKSVSVPPLYRILQWVLFLKAKVLALAFMVLWWSGLHEFCISTATPSPAGSQTPDRFLPWGLCTYSSLTILPRGLCTYSSLYLEGALLGIHLTHSLTS
jgi:hypothetical protein